MLLWQTKKHVQIDVYSKQTKVCKKQLNTYTFSSWLSLICCKQSWNPLNGSLMTRDTALDYPVHWLYCQWHLSCCCSYAWRNLLKRALSHLHSDQWKLGSQTTQDHTKQIHSKLSVHCSEYYVFTVLIVELCALGNLNSTNVSIKRQLAIFLYYRFNN